MPFVGVHLGRTVGKFLTKDIDIMTITLDLFLDILLAHSFHGMAETMVGTIVSREIFAKSRIHFHETY